MRYAAWLAVVILTIMPGMGFETAAAREVTVAVPRSVPPYVIPENWSGIEYEVVKRSLALVGHSMVPRLTVLARLPKEMQTQEIDAAMTMRPETGVVACYSNPHVTYRNYAVSLDKNNLRIDSTADLADKSVVAFQNAHVYLGEDYARATQNTASYREEANQVVQALLLYSDRIQVAVADHNIFRWFAAEVRGKVDVTQRLRLHPIFPPTEYQMAFRDPALCAQFNQGLAQLKESGEFDRIVARYLSQMENNLAQAVK